MISDFITHHTELAPATIAIYKTASKHIVGNPEKGKPADPIARKKLLDLEPTDIKAFYERLVTGDTMKSKVHILLHRVLEEAVDLELIHRNPASRVPKPQVPYQEMAVWKPAEMRRFIKAAQGHRLYALFLLSICSTMGPAELFGLQRRDLSLDKHYLVVNRNLVTVEGRVHEKETKVGKRRRRIKLPKIVVRALRERLRIAEAEGHAGSPYVFTSDEGHPLRGDNFRNRIWKPLLEKAKVPIVEPYAMRHSANALMGHLGVPIEVAQARMGHTSIKTTVDVYGHLFDASGEAVADKLDVFFKGLK
jgi:integrase